MAIRYRVTVRGPLPTDLPTKLAAIQAAAIVRSRTVTELRPAELEDDPSEARDKKAEKSAA